MSSQVKSESSQVKLESSWVKIESSWVKFKLSWVMFVSSQPEFFCSITDWLTDLLTCAIYRGTFAPKNSMVIPTQDVVPNNSDNVRSSQHEMMQAQVRSKIIRNYSTMPIFDGVSVDRDNIYDWSNIFATWTSINDPRSILHFKKTTVYFVFTGRALSRVKPVSLGTLNYQQCNTLEVYVRMLFEQCSPNMMLASSKQRCLISSK